VILCISANPAIDRRLHLERLTVGGVIRACFAAAAPGGKAAHVAMAAQALGEAVRWVGFSGGATGDECERGLVALGIPVEAIHTRSATRVNIEIIDAMGVVTEVLEPGGAVTVEEVSELLRACRELFATHLENAVVVLSGSLPPGAPIDFYAQLIHLAQTYGCRTLLDAGGASLLSSLAAAPDLIKPNREEAASAAGFAVTSIASAAEAARCMIERGARSAAVSLGADGLLLLKENDAAPVFAAPAPVDARSTVGCGDATVAGFAVAAARGMSDAETLRLAVACGAANCLASLPGQIQAAEVERLAPLVSIRELEGE